MSASQSSQISKDKETASTVGTSAGDTSSLYSASTLPLYSERSEQDFDQASTQSLLPKPSLSSALSRAKAKVTGKGKERAPLTEEEAEKAAKKEQEKQQRKEDYERLNMGDKVKFGLGKGSLQMHG